MGTHHWCPVLLLAAALLGSTRAADTTCGIGCQLTELSNPLHCKPEDGCIPDSTYEPADGDDATCWKKKCKQPSIGFAHKQMVDDLVETVKCDATTGKWVDAAATDEVIEEAVCVVKFECYKKPKPNTACLHPEYDLSSHGCVDADQLDFTNDNDKSCPNGKKIFIFEDNDWTEVQQGDKLKCEPQGWKLMPSDTLLVGTQVICATNKPAKLQKCTGVILDTPDGTQLDGDVDKVAPLPDIGDISCTAPKQLYFKKQAESFWTKAVKISCDRREGKFVHNDGSLQPYSLEAADAVVCAASTPYHKGCDTSRPRSECHANLPSDVACTKLADDNSAKKCSGTGEKLYVDEGDDGTWEDKHDKLECDATGKWEASDSTGANPTIAVTPADKAICAKKDPAIPCVMTMEQPSGAGLHRAATYGQVTYTSSEITCSGSLQLYIERANVWTLAQSVTCNPKTGWWMEALPTPAQVSPTEKLICASALPKARDLGCQSGSNKLTDGCPGLPSDPTIGCTPTKFGVDTLDCSPANLYYKDSVTSIWEAVPATTQITCDWQGSDKWTGVAAIDSGVASEVICADKNPTPDARYCQIGNHPLKPSICPSEKSDCTPITSFDNGVTCADPTPKIFFTTTAAGGVWTETTKIACYPASKEWKQGEDAAATPLTDGPVVVCANSNPGVMCKNTQPTLACPASTDPKPVPSQYNCADTVITAANGDAMDACAAPGKRFILKAGVWEDASTIVCDKDGTWKLPSITTPYTVQPTDVVICAERNPSLPIPSTCSTAMTSLCDAPNGKPTTTCTEPTGLTSELSCTTGNLYFKKKDTVKFYMKAESIACTPANTWNVTYKFGSSSETEVLQPETAQVTCDAANPTPIACSLSLLNVDLNKYGQHSPAKSNYEAGEKANCDDNIFVVPNSNPQVPTAILASTINSDIPVCNPNDGKWIAQDTSEVTSFGDKLGCAIEMCKQCPDDPLDTDHLPLTNVFDNALPVNNDPLERIKTDTCDFYKCAFDRAMGITTSGSEQYLSNRIYCSSDKKWKIGGKKATGAKCIQHWPCLNNNNPPTYYQEVKLECPNGVEGCVSPKKDKQGNNNNNYPETILTCPDDKLMLAKHDSEDWWHTLVGRKLECDTVKGKWPAKKQNIYDATLQDPLEINHEYTIICNTSNTNPEQTTTTTTMATTTPMEICAMCGMNLHKFFGGCDTCAKLEDTKRMRGADDNECILILNNNMTGYILLVNQTVQTKLVCKRSDGIWRTESGQEVKEKQIKAQLQVKKGEWKTTSYVILAVGIIAIGGMAIGCVAIYMRMRKKISEREPKKKERGVTKKYTAANVMRTGGRSKGGSKESGKSKEPTPSKMEENIEDAPTLKL